MSEVLFVLPSNSPSISQECEGSLLLATILRQNGLDVDIYRFYEADTEKGFDSFTDETVNNILSRTPSIVSFYCRCDCFLADIKIAEKIKEKRPEIFIVFGGPQADAVRKDVITELDFVDYCCSGEGEETVYPLFSGLLNGEDVTGIPGLTYRNAQGEVICNPTVKLRTDLSDLPFVDYSFIPQETIDNMIRDNTMFPVEVGRGCPFNCAYCSTSMFWERKFRLKSAKRIVQEMVRLNKEYGVKRFHFQHDLFTANKKKVLEFCHELKESGLDVSWGCSSRIDTIDAEMIDAMVDCGLIGVYFGIETGSPRMQKIINKNLDIQQVIDVCRILCEKKVHITGSFMYGFPEETEEDIEQTLQLVYTLNKLGVKVFQYHLCAMFPGTEYYRKYRDELVFAEVYSDQVSDFGVKDNFEFISAHKNLFPFYYEYHSKLRDDFCHLTECAAVCLFIYEQMMKLDNEKFSTIALTEVYKGFVEANKDVLDGMSIDDCFDNFAKLSETYLSTLYSEEDMKKLREILMVSDISNKMKRTKGDATEVMNFSVDISAYSQGKSLKDIGLAPSMVIFRKQGKEVTWVVRRMPG